jgi:predicted ATPase
MMDEQVRVSNHLTFGRCLVEPSLESGDDDMLFVGVNHINLAGRGAISDARDFAIMAQFNLTAGKRAVEMSDFSSASSFFSHGIQFLPDSHWTQEYTLSLELFELASKTSLATGNYSNLQTYSGAVIQYGRTFEDKLKVYYIIMQSLTYASKIIEALDKGLEILSRLGEVIPR